MSRKAAFFSSLRDERSTAACASAVTAPKLQGQKFLGPLEKVRRFAALVLHLAENLAGFAAQVDFRA